MLRAFITRKGKRLISERLAGVQQATDSSMNQIIDNVKISIGNHMSYGNGLAFSTLSEYNGDRVNYFRHGGIQGWGIDQWSNAIAGETGELCNLTKKVIRGDFGIGMADCLAGNAYDVLSPGEVERVRQDIADELADIVTYCDLLAQKCHINLGHAILDKFNRVSKRVGYNGVMRAE